MRTLFVIAAIILPALASATTFSDPFTNDPFFTPRWCERIHHVHWDSINALVSGVNGTTCLGGGLSCCTCSTPPNNCSATNEGAHQLITSNSYTGNTRSAQTTFAVQRAWQNSGSLFEHVAVFSIAHPKCHAGYQAFVGPDAAHPGKYILQVTRSDDANGGSGAGNCGLLGGLLDPTNVGNITLVTTTLPRYTLSISTSVSGANVITSAKLVDSSTSTVLATIPPWTSVKPIWYNTTEARQFSLGGILDPTIMPSSTIPHDNFVGTYAP